MTSNVQTVQCGDKGNGSNLTLTFMLLLRFFSKTVKKLERSSERLLTTLEGKIPWQVRTQSVKQMSGGTGIPCFALVLDSSSSVE